MLPDISEIKSKRKKLNLTQLDLAKFSNVSQALIAKLESGKCDPSYNNTKKIFDALEMLGSEKIIFAKDIMNTKVITIKHTDSIKKCISLMSKHNVSQLPVLKDKQILGLVSEQSILEKIKSENISNPIANEAIQEEIVIVNEDTLVRRIKELLKDNLAAIVCKKGKIIGIISRSDLLKTL